MAIFLYLFFFLRVSLTFRPQILHVELTLVFTALSQEASYDSFSLVIAQYGAAALT